MPPVKGASRNTGGAPPMASLLLPSSPKPLHQPSLRFRLPAIGITNPHTNSFSSAENQEQFFNRLNLLSQATPLTKVKLDPLKALEPSQKKLSKIESQRIIGVLDELRLKSEIIIVLPHVMRDLKRYKDILGSRIFELLQSHSEFFNAFTTLEKQYLELSVGQMAHHRAKTQITDSARTLIAEQIKLPNQNRKESISVVKEGSVHSSNSFSPEALAAQETNDFKIQDTLARLNSMKPKLEFTIRNILRAFREEDERMQMLLVEAGGGKSREGSYFLQCLNELRDLIFERLLITPMEQNDKMLYMAQVRNAQQLYHTMQL